MRQDSMDFATAYSDPDCISSMANLIAPRVERFVQRLLGIAGYECSDGRYPGFSSEIIGCHYPLTDAHVEHINRVVVGHLMLRCDHLAYFASRLDPTLTRAQRKSYDGQLRNLGQLFRGQTFPPGMTTPLKQPLVFALAIVHDIGKTAFLGDAGHEERGGNLVRAVLDLLADRLGISSSEVGLGGNLIENHTMLGTLVQAEQSAFHVLKHLRSSCNTSDEHRMFLSYLLLLNSMDLSGYRYLPVILDPYWAERYTALADLGKLEEYGTSHEEFALYRLRQLARNNVSDTGEIKVKQDFHRACEDCFTNLSTPLQETIGTIRIRDALYLIMDFNRVAIGDSPRFPVSHASTYIALLKTLAGIAQAAGSHTIAFCGQGYRTVNTSHLERLIDHIRKGESICDPTLFTNHDDVTQFTISSDGMISLC